VTSQEVSGSDALPPKIRVHRPHDRSLADGYTVSLTTSVVIEVCW